METKVFTEYKNNKGINDTLTIFIDDNFIKFKTSCNRDGYVRFNKQQVKSMIKYLQKLVK
jgi:hypothetical protein